MGELARRFGERLRSLRTERRLTQAQLGEAAGTTDEWVRRIEAGTGSPSFDKIEALARALMVDPVELFAPAERGAGDLLRDRVSGLTEPETLWLAGLVDQLKQRPGR